MFKDIDNRDFKITLFPYKFKQIVLQNFRCLSQNNYTEMFYNIQIKFDGFEGLIIKLQ